MNVSYPLDGHLNYWRRDTPEAALYAMLTHVSRRRREAGEQCEFGFLYFTDADYVGVVFMNSEAYQPGMPAPKLEAVAA